MASLTTALVGRNQQTLASAPIGGAKADQVLIINLDLVNTVNLGSSSTNLIFPLGPLASTTLTAPVFAAAATVPLLVGIAPGGSSYSPGSLTITGPVTAEITGPVTVEGTVDIGAGSVGISGTVDVAITGTPTVDIASGSVDITAGNVDVTGVGGFVAPGAYSLVENDTTTHTVASGTSYTTPIYNMTTYQSYTIQAQGYCGTQGFLGAPLCVPVIVSYYANAAGTILIDTERWWMWLGLGASSATPINGSGPLRGGYVSITIGNPVGSQPVTVTKINVYGAGRSLSESIWQQTPPSAITTGIDLLTSSAPIVPLPGDDKILANESDNNITPSNTYWWPLPLYSGTVTLYFATSTALAADFVVATAQGLQYGDITAGDSTQGVVWNPGNTAGTAYTADIEVGNAPLYIVVKSTSAPVTLITFTAQGS